MLYIVTPCSRPENLPFILSSIVMATNNNISDGFIWVIILDGKLENKEEIYKKLSLDCMMAGIECIILLSPIKNSFVGHSHRNFFLDNWQIKNLPISKGFANWIYFLDDDTLLHIDFINYVLPELKEYRTAVIFDQLNRDGSHRLFANEGQIKVCHIDMGQYVINLDKLPKTHRFKEDDYTADGIFIEELHNMTADKSTFHIINKPCSIYNALR